METGGIEFDERMEKGLSTVRLRVFHSKESIGSSPLGVSGEGGEGSVVTKSEMPRDSVSSYEEWSINRSWNGIGQGSRLKNDVRTVFNAKFFLFLSQEIISFFFSFFKKNFS